MPRGKLILICQSGGEFVTTEDGCLSYIGGEAHALDINHETLFDDLKLKLAEMCNLEYKSLSMKYFLPGNRRTLITLSNEKDLKRMHDFHQDSVTADIYVTGREGFNSEAFFTHATREFGVKPAETVTSSVPSQAAATTPVAVVSGTTSISAIRKVARAAVAHRSHRKSSNTEMTVNATTQRPTSVVLAITSKRLPRYRVTNDSNVVNVAPINHVAAPADATVDVPVTFDMNCTPADTVKRRRRTASWKIGAHGLTIVPVSDNSEETKKVMSRKKNSWSHDIDTNSSDEEWQLEQTNTELWIDGVNSTDVPLEIVIASWKNGIIGIGQDFKSVVEFRDALQKYAIAHRFVYRFKKNDTSRASARCVVEDCPWKIHASWVPSEEVFRVKKFNKSHTCEGESWKGAHPSKNWLVGIIKDRLRDSPHQKPKEIANGIFRDFGMQLNYTQIWRGIEDAKEQLQGSHKEAYNQLPWFCDKIVEANPGSVAKLSISEDSKFQRLFVSFHASIYGFQNGCRPLLFLDSTQLRSKYHEILLTVTALDGDDGLFPVAFAIVDIENNDNWHWFLEQLRSAISTSRPITFVSDKEKGLMKPVLELFENAYHGYSIFHLLENFRRNLKGPFHGDGKGSLPGSFLAAAHAVRLDGFRMFTEQIRRVSLSAYDWLMQIEPEHWANALFKGERYSRLSINVADFYANWVEEVRGLPIIPKVEALRCKMMELMYSRQIDSNGWIAKLTPSKEKKLQEETLKAQFLKVLFSSDTLFEVHDDSIHVVDTEKKDCTCLTWNMIGLPCCHAIAVFNRKGKSLYDYCSKYFTVNSYRETYSQPMNTVLANFTAWGEEIGASSAGHILPPSTPRPPTQPKEKRSRTLGEPRRTVCCTRCKGEGHNKATCKETNIATS